jgi:glutamyl-tRNA synthetase
MNMLALLGWNPGDDREIFSMDELAEEFTIERVGKSGSKFDPSKAIWFNHQYLIKENNNKLADMLLPIAESNGVLVEKDKMSKVIGIVKERANFAKDIWNQLDFFFVRPQEFDAKAVKKRWKHDSYDQMNELKDILYNINSFKSEHTEEVVKTWIENKEYGMGMVMNALRLLIVGALKGPHLFDIIAILGKDETLKRMDQGLNKLGRKE